MFIFFYSIIILWCKQEVFINIAKYSVKYLHEVKTVIGDWYILFSLPFFKLNVLISLKKKIACIYF